ncbi:arylsulfatase [Acidobacteriota bacterium]
MERRTFIKTGSAAAASLLLGSRCKTSKSQVTGLKGRRPHIILVMTDDQGYGDLSCFGNPVLKTPHLDSLHSQSLRFTRFQVSPTCAPTRSSLLTGRHEFKNGVTHTILERERLTLDAVTLADVLKNAGYSTGIFGKWHLGDEDDHQPERRGFDEVFIHGAGGIGQKYPGSCADVPPNQENRYFDPVIRHNGTFKKTRGFCTDVFFRQALGWINEQRTKDRPIFSLIVTNAPHSPYIAPDNYIKRFLESGLDEKLSGFYGMIENIDDNVGILVNKLKEWGLEDNTLLIFMTDNGTAAGHGIHTAGMRGNKGTPWEGGTRVPAFFRWKERIPEGVDVDRLTAHIDIFPTLAEIAKAELPMNGQVEGRSLVPLLQDASAEWNDRFLFTHVGRWKKGADPDLSKFDRCAVRNQRFRFMNNEELFDLETDPGQEKNVIDDHPEQVEMMRDAYDSWWAECRPLMVNEDTIYEGTAPYIKNYNRQLEDQGIPDWEPPVY